MNIIKIIREEITNYESKSYEISEGVHRSAYKRIKRIAFFQNRGGDTDKIDELGQYQYWLDTAKIYIDSTVKNLRIDTKNFLVFSKAPIDDFPAVFTANCALKDYMFDTNRDIQLKEDTEYFVGWGNILWRKILGGHETCDFMNTYIINQTARTINETPVIERHQLTQSQLREMEGVYSNIEEVIESCGNKFFSATNKTTEDTTTNPIYEIFIRNGEVSEKDLFEAQGKKGGDKNKFLLARIVVVLDKIDKDGKNYVLFAKEFPKNKKMSDFYKEAHLGTYNGTWFREGIYEQLMDYIVAIREIDNDIQEGLTWASKVIFRSSDNKTFQNIRTDIENGRMIQSKDLSQVDVRLQNLDQLIARRNNLIEEMNQVTHAFEIVQGQNMPSGTTLGTVRIIDENATKYYANLKTKFTIPLKHVYKEWELPNIVKDLKAQDIIKITGNSAIIDQFRKMAVNSWYIKNLVKIGPHTIEMREQIKAQKLEELSNYDALIKNMPEIWEGVLKRLYITISGENLDMSENLTTLQELLKLELDPVRRAFVLDTIYAIKNIPIPPPVNMDLQQAQLQPEQQQKI
jgi:hypothetical protein